MTIKFEREKLLTIVNKSKSFRECGRTLNTDHRTIKKHCDKLGITYTHFDEYKKEDGNKYQMLTVLESYVDRIKRVRTIAKCKCDCGNLFECRLDLLKIGKYYSCGCFDRRKLNVGNLSKSWKGLGFLPKTYFTDINRDARKRNLEFSVTMEYLSDLYEKQNHKCNLSGLAIGFSKARSYISTASLDRIDSSKGYVEGNVQWIYKDINFMKRDYPQDYFLRIVAQIAKHKQLS